MQFFYICYIILFIHYKFIIIVYVCSFMGYSNRPLNKKGWFISWFDLYIPKRHHNREIFLYFLAFCCQTSNIIPDSCVPKLQETTQFMVRVLKCVMKQTYYLKKLNFNVFRKITCISVLKRRVKKSNWIFDWN